MTANPFNRRRTVRRRPATAAVLALALALTPARAAHADPDDTGDGSTVTEPATLTVPPHPADEGDRTPSPQPAAEQSEPAGVERTASTSTPSMSNPDPDPADDIGDVPGVELEPIDPPGSTAPSDLATPPVNQYVMPAPSGTAEQPPDPAVPALLEPVLEPVASESGQEALSDTASVAGQPLDRPGLADISGPVPPEPADPPAPEPAVHGAPPDDPSAPGAVETPVGPRPERPFAPHGETPPAPVDMPLASPAPVPDEPVATSRGTGATGGGTVTTAVAARVPPATRSDTPTHGSSTVLGAAAGGPTEARGRPLPPRPAAGGSSPGDLSLVAGVWAGGPPATLGTATGDVRPIVFPVLGPTTFWNDWGACRDGCARLHQGTDLLGVRLQPLLAASDGTITRVRSVAAGKAGVVVTITDPAGWSYNYFHVNNDEPHSDSGTARREWQVPGRVRVGAPIRAGELVAFMGDSGNAETSVPHLHFEIRRPDGTPINPYPSLMAAAARQQCAVAPGLVDRPPDGTSPLDPVAAVTPLDGSGRWLIAAAGWVAADGDAATVHPTRDVGCPPPVLSRPPAAALPPAPAVVDEPTPVPGDTAWTVATGDCLWSIVRAVYVPGTGAATVALVAVVFDHNRHLLAVPDELEVGMTLQLPPVPLDPTAS